MTYVPLDAETRAQMVANIAALKESQEKSGGWTSKFDARTTGFSYYAQFANRVEVEDCIKFVQRMEAGTQMISTALERLLAADDEVQRRKPALTKCGSNGRHWYTVYGNPGLRRPDCARCGAPNPRKLSADEQANWDYYVNEEGGR